MASEALEVCQRYFSALETARDYFLDGRIDLVVSEPRFRGVGAMRGGVIAKLPWNFATAQAFDDDFLRR